MSKHGAVVYFLAPINWDYHDKGDWKIESVLPRLIGRRNANEVLVRIGRDRYFGRVACRELIVALTRHTDDVLEALYWVYDEYEALTGRPSAPHFRPRPGRLRDEAIKEAKSIAARRRRDEEPAGDALLRATDQRRGKLQRRREERQRREIATCRAGYKFPREEWSAVRWTGSAQKTADLISRRFAPGYTAEPYVQLVIDGERYVYVLAEYSQGEWISPLAAAGWLPRTLA